MNASWITSTSISTTRIRGASPQESCSARRFALALAACPGVRPGKTPCIRSSPCRNLISCSLAAGMLTWPCSAPCHGPLARGRFTLVTPEGLAPYSGMLPAHVAGFVLGGHAHRSRPLARAGGVRLIEAEVVGLTRPSASCALLIGRP